jgi:AcrR family transcriptional regulator
MNSIDDVTLTRVDGRRARGERTRTSILEAAARLASVEGLEGLSIGSMARHLGISKSGLYAHFRSKEELQLATIRAAEAIYERDVVGPALEAPMGKARLLALCDAFFDYVRSGVFPGGCFFIANSLDPATARRGRVKELLARIQRETLDGLEEWVRDAQERDGAVPGRDPRHVAFEIDSLMTGADRNFVLFGDSAFLEDGRTAIRRILSAPELASG